VANNDIATKGEKICPDDRSAVMQTFTQIDRHFCQDSFA